MTLHKQFVTDENKNPIAVQIPIEEFQQIEELLEDRMLGEIIELRANEPALSLEESLAELEALSSSRK